MRSSVVFPAPDGPTMETNSPERTENDSPSIARCAVGPVP